MNHETGQGSGGICRDFEHSLSQIETIISIAERNGMAVSTLTNFEIEDARPAAMVVHTRLQAQG